MLTSYKGGEQVIELSQELHFLDMDEGIARAEEGTTEQEKRACISNVTI